MLKTYSTLIIKFASTSDFGNVQVQLDDLQLLPSFTYLLCIIKPWFFRQEKFLCIIMVKLTVSIEEQFSIHQLKLYIYYQQKFLKTFFMIFFSGK